MTDGWKGKLRFLSEQEPDEGKLRRLVDVGHRPLSDLPETPDTRSKVVAGVVALVVFVGGFSLIWSSIDGEPAPPGDSPSVEPSESDVPAPTEQVVGYHGLLLTVPASWTINDEACGTPRSDTVLRDLGAVLSCLIPRPPGISTVELLDDPSYSLPQVQQEATLTNANGVRLKRGTLPDRPGIAVYVPAVGVMMLIDTVADAQTQEIVDSIELADVDPHGCAMHEQELAPPASYEPPAAMKDALIPGSPTAIAICHYVDDWLRSSASLEGEDLSRFVDMVNGLEEGFVYAPTDTYDPSLCNEPSSEGGELGAGYVLWVHGIDHEPVPLWAHVGICGGLGIENGAREGQLTPLFAKLLHRPLHAGFVMPGRLIPGPSA